MFDICVVCKERPIMDNKLKEAIHHIIDGDAVLITGAGASLGAKNVLGENLPTGQEFAKRLFIKGGMKEEEAEEEAEGAEAIQEGAQYCIEQLKASGLINYLKQEFMVSEPQKYNVDLYDFHWQRRYTVNYDTIPAFDRWKDRKALSSIDFATNIQDDEEFESDRCCIHINGWINHLNKDALNTYFRLTKMSYFNRPLSQSSWYQVLADDLQSCSYVFAVGLSFMFDFELTQLLCNLAGKSKLIIINPVDTNKPRKMRQFKDFGCLYNMTTEKFVDAVRHESEIYKPKKQSPFTYNYKYFYHNSHWDDNISQMSLTDSVKCMYFNGKFIKQLCSSNADYGLIDRNQVRLIDSAVSDQKIKVCFIHSSLGNGKTGAIHLLAEQLKSEHKRFFLLRQEGKASLMRKEIRMISSIDEKCVIIIEDYAHNLHVVSYFAEMIRSHDFNTDNFTFVLTSRSALHWLNMNKVLSELRISQSDVREFSLNVLNNGEAKRLVKSLRNYSLLGDYVNNTDNEVIQRIKQGDNNAVHMSSAVLEIVKSMELKRRFEAITDELGQTNPAYLRVVILILCVPVFNVRESLARSFLAAKYSDVINNFEFQHNAAVEELLSFDDGISGQLRIKSPIAAKALLTSLSVNSELFSILVEFIKFCDKQNDMNALEALTSRSNFRNYFESSLNDQDLSQFRLDLLDYYQQIAADLNIHYTKNNPFFCHHYAMTYLACKRFDDCQRLLNDAYKIAKATQSLSFIPYQFNITQAELYLEEIKAGICSSVEERIDLFQKADSLMRDTEIVQSERVERRKMVVSSYDGLKSVMTTLEEKALIKRCKRDTLNTISGSSHFGV